MSIRQDIDLLQRPPIRWEDQVLNIHVVLSVSLLLLLLFSALIGYEYWQQRLLQRKLLAAQFLQQQSSQELSRLQDFLDPQKRQQQHQLNLSRLQQSLSILQAQDKFQEGFSQRLLRLSTLRYPGLWLTELRFSNADPHWIYLKGQANSAEAVSQFLQQLQQQPELSQYSLKQLNLKENKEHLQEFLFDSQDAATNPTLSSGGSP